MIRKVILMVSLLLLLLSAASALAGGWVVISLETLPQQIHAGEPLQVSFMVRQHGQTPIHSVEPMLTASNAETGERIQVKAEPAKELGRFLATVDFPSAGVWEWSISAEPFPQTAAFAPLSVQAARETGVTGSTIQPALDGQAVLRWSGLTLLVASVLIFALDRRRASKVAAPASGD